MATVAVPLYEGKGYGIDRDGRWYAEQTFLVHDDGGAMISEVDAALYVATLYPRNAPHPRNPTLKVSSIDPAGNEGPAAWKQRVVWSIPENGGRHPDDNPENLTDLTPVVEWDDQQIEVPMEWDGDCRLVCNSAGFPPSSPPMRTVDVDVLRITRYEPYYNLALLKTLRRRVNDSAVVLGGNTFEKGQVFLNKAKPAQSFPVGTTPIQMVYEWWFDDHAPQPFQTYFADKGSYGWVTPPGAGSPIPGPFGTVATVDGVTQFQQVSDPVLLDGTGKPVLSGYKVGYKSGDTWQGGDPVSFPSCNTAPYDQPSTSDIPTVAPWVRRYRKVLFADFSVLGI